MVAGTQPTVTDMMRQQSLMSEQGDDGVSSLFSDPMYSSTVPVSGPELQHTTEYTTSVMPTIQYSTTLLPSVNTLIARGMFCGAKYTHHKFTPIIKHLITTANKI